MLSTCQSIDCERISHFINIMFITEINTMFTTVNNYYSNLE